MIPAICARTVDRQGAPRTSRRAHLGGGGFLLAGCALPPPPTPAEQAEQVRRAQYVRQGRYEGERERQMVSGQPMIGYGVQGQADAARTNRERQSAADWLFFDGLRVKGIALTEQQKEQTLAEIIKRVGRSGPRRGMAT